MVLNLKLCLRQAPLLLKTRNTSSAAPLQSLKLYVNLKNIKILKFRAIFLSYFNWLFEIGSQHGGPMVEQGSKEEKSWFLPQKYAFLFFISH